jgi:branched-chain amino acid transport system permease protein
VQYVSDQYRDAYVFAILILVLLFKPEGVFGKATVEKV